MENKLAHVNDSMFERNIAIIASRKQEVQIFSGGFVYEGYICGMDESWIQMYGHEENDKNNADIQWRFLLLYKNTISAIGPNGNGLHDYTDDIHEWIDKKIHMFSEVCEKFLSVRGTKNDNRREKI
jgi:hypothetical protein